ncbi:hypothetical protein jhhlp_008871 [Lomentospora prolificans]|uniref:Uncharacterized protein n=1 Tax=Lomentospora prolificans TaxID=41688 RepID=A0A2N3MZ85_9PEZI|nr:hypothetical protein jhhlp_008871 [Lomentospora prolificans]
MHSSASSSASPRPPAQDQNDDVPRKSPLSEPELTLQDNEKRQEPEFDIRAQDDEPNDGSNPFAFNPTKLHRLSEARSIAALNAFGGLPGLAAGLRTDLEAGLGSDEDVLDGTVTIDEAVAAGRERRRPQLRHRSHESQNQIGDLLKLGAGSARTGFSDRIRVFGENILPRRKQKSFFRLAWIAFNDKLIMLLSVSATISLALGIYQSVDPEEEGSNIEWVDGVTVVVAILVIVFASAATDWQKNHKFEKLNERKEQRDVTVVRSGKPQRVSIHDVLVGDLMRVEAGDIIAVDGVLVQAAGIQINESSITGESELVHKHVVSDQHPTADPFLLSGTTMSGGYGTYLVTSVGVNSTYGRTLMSLRHDVEETPLQQRLGRLAKQLISIGAIAGAIFFLIIFIRFLIQLKDKDWSPAEKAKEFFQVLILAVTVIVITVPEGLALAVTIALAFATSRMLKDNNLVRLIRSCEIMGNATCICSDKTGTLTKNDMMVVVGTVGLDGQFSDHRRDVQQERGTPVPTPSEGSISGSTKDKMALMTSRALTDSLSPAIRQLIKESVALNSTAFESDNIRVDRQC